MTKKIHIDGIASIIERGKEFKELFTMFHNKFEWVRMDPWNEGETPFVKIQ